MPRIVVVGAGIGGLCAARAAALAGHDPVVIERSPAGTALGAGLVLWPNAVHALDALGHGPAVRAVAAVARRAVFLGASGGKLSEIDLEAVGRSEGAPMLVVERPALQAVLADGLAVRHTRGERGRRARSDAGGRGADRRRRDHRRRWHRIRSTPLRLTGSEPLDTGHTVIRGIAEHDIGPARHSSRGAEGSLSAVRRCRADAPIGSTRLRAGGSRNEPARCSDARRWPTPIPEQVAATDPESVLINRIVRLNPQPDLDAWEGHACSATRPTRWSRTSARERPRPSKTPRRCSSRCADGSAGRCAFGLRRDSAPARAHVPAAVLALRPTRALDPLWPARPDDAPDPGERCAGERRRSFCAATPSRGSLLRSVAPRPPLSSKAATPSLGLAVHEGSSVRGPNRIASRPANEALDAYARRPARAPPAQRTLAVTAALGWGALAASSLVIGALLGIARPWPGSPHRSRARLRSRRSDQRRQLRPRGTRRTSRRPWGAGRGPGPGRGHLLRTQPMAGTTTQAR